MQVETKMFNPKDFSIKDEIKKRVNQESLYYWANSENPTIPKMKIEFKKIPLTVGLYNLIRQIKP